MTARVIGGALVCISCALLGLYMGDKGVRRAALIQELKRTLLMLKSEIEYALYPLPHALEKVAERAGQPLSDFYLAVAARLAAKEMTMAEAWMASAAIIEHTALTKEDVAVLNGVGRALGCIDVAVQAGTIDLPITELDGKLERLGEENAKNVRMYRGLGILGGLLITVVLL